MSFIRHYKEGLETVKGYNRDTKVLTGGLLAAVPALEALTMVSKDDPTDDRTTGQKAMVGATGGVIASAVSANNLLLEGSSSLKNAKYGKAVKSLAYGAEIGAGVGSLGASFVNGFDTIDGVGAGLLAGLAGGGAHSVLSSSKFSKPFNKIR